jgi:predicted GIY-YIG superfamily endonuclease
LYVGVTNNLEKRIYQHKKNLARLENLVGADF